MGENGKIVFKAVKDVTFDAGSVTTASGAANGVNGGSITVEGQNITNAGVTQANAGDNASAGSISMVAQNVLALEDTSRTEARGASVNSSGGNLYFYSYGDAFAKPGQVIDVSGGTISGRGGTLNSALPA